MGEAEKRDYIILEEARGEEGATAPTFFFRGEVQATGAEQAVREYAKVAGDSLREPTVFVAITKRSWFRAPVEVQTQTRLVIG